MNIDKILDNYDKTYLERQCWSFLKKPLILKVKSKEKLSRKQIVDIPLKLLLPLTNKEINSGDYLPQVTPFKIPFPSELMKVVVTISADNKFEKLIDNKLFKDKFYYNMREFNDDHKFEEIFFKLEFSLNNISSESSLEEEFNSFFEKINVRDMYLNVFYNKIAQMNAIKVNKDISEKVKKRFSNNRFSVINYGFDISNVTEFCDFGIKKIEQFYQAMRFFFFHYSDEEWNSLVMGFNPISVYPYIKDLEQYNLLYQIDKIEDIFEEQID